MAGSLPLLDVEVGRVLHDAVAQVQDLQVDGSLALALVTYLQREPRPATLQHDLEAAGRLLTRTAERIDALEHAEAGRHPLGMKWFEVRRRDMERVPEPDRASELGSMWLSAVDGEQFVLSEQIVGLSRVALVNDTTRTWMSVATDAFAACDPADALPALAELVDSFPGIAVRLTALQALIHLRATGDTTAALQRATRALKLARRRRHRIDCPRDGRTRRGATRARGSRACRQDRG